MTDSDYASQQDANQEVEAAVTAALRRVRQEFLHAGYDRPGGLSQPHSPVRVLERTAASLGYPL